MKIIDEEGAYWTEGKGNYTGEDGTKVNKLGFWSKFELVPNDKRDFFIVKALLLFLLMKLNGNKARIVK